MLFPFCLPVFLSGWMSVCVYVCSRVRKLFLNRFFSVIYQQMRIYTKEGYPKTDLKSKLALKNYSGNIHISVIWFFLHSVVQKHDIASEMRLKSFINRGYLSCFLYLVVISLLSVCVSGFECLSVCVYVCSHVEKLFLNRCSSMIYPQTRINNRKESPKPNSKSNRMLKSYFKKTHNSATFKPISKCRI